MAGQDYAKPWVERALREGIGPTAALRMAREGGLRIGNSAWFQTYGNERNNLALRARAHDLPLNRRPTSDEIGQWDTVRRTGFAYRVVGVMKDRETGAEMTTIVTVTYNRLVSRGRAIQDAGDAFQDPDEKYPGQLMGMFTAGVFAMVPLDTGEEE